MRYLLLFFCLLISLTVSAQNTKIDSLKKVIATTKVDTVKGRSLCRLAERLMFVGAVDEAKELVDKGIQLSFQIDDSVGLLDCYLDQGVIFAQQGGGDEALVPLQKAQKIASATQNVRGTVIALCFIGNVYAGKGEYDKAIDYLNQSLVLSEKKDYIEGKLKAVSNLAVIYDITGKTELAIREYHKALQINIKLNNAISQANQLGNLGTAYRTLGDLPKALDYLQKSARIFNNLGDKRSIVMSYINIASVYMDMKDYQKSKENYQLALRQAEEIKDLNNQSLALHNLAVIAFKSKNKQDQEKGKAFLEKSTFLKEKVGNMEGLVFGKVLLVEKVLIPNQEYQKALQTATDAYELANKINSADAKIFSLKTLYHSRFYLGHYAEANKIAHKALKVAQEAKAMKNVVEIYEIISQSDSALGDYNSAYVHYKLYTLYKDSLYNEDKAKEFGRVESKYEFEKEAEEAKRKQEELAKMEAEETERRDNLQYLTIFAGIIGLFAGLVFIGKFRIPTRVLDVAIFAGLLITFEFLLILFDPVFDRYSGGIPFYKLGFNAIVAFAFAPLHGFLEGKLKKRLVKAEKA